MLPEEANVYADEFTKEAFFAELSQNSNGLNIWDECAPVLKQIDNPRSYLSGIDDTVMALYNGQGRTKDLRSGKFTVTEPCFNMLWATTKVNFAKYVKQDQFLLGSLQDL